MVPGRVDFVDFVDFSGCVVAPPGERSVRAASGGGAEGVGGSVEGPLWPTSLRACGALAGCIEGVMLMLCADLHAAVV